MLAFVEKIWIYFDDNEDSYISKSEMLPYFQLSLGDDTDQESAAYLFQMIDTTRRGLLIKSEMIKFFNKLFIFLKALKKGDKEAGVAQRIFGID